MKFEFKFLGLMFALTLFIIGGGVWLVGRQDSGAKTGVEDLSTVVTEGRNTTGDANSAVKIIEFGDFQCPACAAAAPIVEKVIADNRDKVVFTFRHYPLPVHNNAVVSSQAAEAAGMQGKFMDMYKLLYERQKDWASSKNPEEVFEKYAEEIGLDAVKYKEDFKNSIGVVNKDYDKGNKLGVNSTPTFFINNQKYVGVLSEEKFRQLITGSN
jgi:protein-disulfide isomerase